MSYTGTVEHGVVVLPPEAGWPDGTKVRVEPLDAAIDNKPLVGRLRAIAQAMPELPTDWAAQHDHYLHGTPKR